METVEARDHSRNGSKGVLAVLKVKFWTRLDPFQTSSGKAGVNRTPAGFGRIHLSPVSCTGSRVNIALMILDGGPAGIQRTTFSGPVNKAQTK